MTVSFNPANPPFNIAITSGAGFPYLGFVGGDLVAGSSFRLTATSATSPGSSASAVGNTFGGSSESAIWYYTPAPGQSGGQFTPQWINSGGVAVPTTLWYFDDSNIVAIVTAPFPNTGFAAILDLQ